MKRLFLAVTACAALTSCGGSMKDMVATMQVETPIPGVCDNTKIIAILPFPGNEQVEAGAPLTDEELEAKLNEEVTFLRDKPDYKDEGIVNLIVNCHGEMVRCEIDNKTQSPELDQQIVAVFAEMKNWKPGTVQGQKVDTSVLYSFDIKDGKIVL